MEITTSPTLHSALAASRNRIRGLTYCFGQYPPKREEKTCSFVNLFVRCPNLLLEQKKYLSYACTIFFRAPTARVLTRRIVAGRAACRSSAASPTACRPTIASAPHTALPRTGRVRIAGAGAAHWLKVNSLPMHVAQYRMFFFVYQVALCLCPVFVFCLVF